MDIGTQSEPASQRGGGGVGRCHPGRRPRRGQGGERRWLTVYSPGGYSWRPTAGDRVLVLKAGAEGESPCILGTAQGERTLGPGEVRIDGGSSSVYLGRGRLELTGNVYINGKNLADLIPGLKK